MEIVNGYPCKNCTDVDYAKKNIDPAHPKDGPNGVDNPEKKAAKAKATSFGPAVTFGGALASLATSDSPDPAATTPPGPGTSQTGQDRRTAIGSQLDIKA